MSYPHSDLRHAHSWAAARRSLNSRPDAGAIATRRKRCDTRSHSSGPHRPGRWNAAGAGRQRWGRRSPAGPGRRTGPGLTASDRGSVSAELVIAMPLLMLLILLIAQFALWAHATHIAQASAAQGLAAARVSDSSTGTGATA